MTFGAVTYFVEDVVFFKHLVHFVSFLLKKYGHKGFQESKRTLGPYHGTIRKNFLLPYLAKFSILQLNKLVDMSIANQNLKYLRKLRGWTQEEFAQKLRIKRSLLGAYEEERAEPRIEVLEVVCDIFKLTLDEILRKDLSDNKGNYIAKRRAMKLVGGRPDIPFVPVKSSSWLSCGLRGS
jgi:DNA-binding XRE family transcriptional regulator